MIEKNKILYLKWFIDFLNTDLDTISTGERMHLAYDVLIISYGMGDLLFNYEKTTLPPERWDLEKPAEEITRELIKGDNLKAYQKRLKDIFLDLIKNYKDAYDFIKEGNKPISDLKHFFELNETSIKIKINMKLRTPILEWETLMKHGDYITARIPKKRLLKAPIHISVKAQKHEDTLLYFFFQALEGLQLDALRNCIECGRFFIHTNRRKKIFCSSKCSMRRANRDRRRRIKEKDKDKYEFELAEGRKRAKKSLERRNRKNLAKT